VQNGGLLAARRKCESELAAMHTDLEDTMNELKSSEDNAKKAMADAARLAEELRQEQEHSTHVERMRHGLEQNMKDIEVRLEDAEQAALKGGKKLIAKLEQRCRELESELDGEQRRHGEMNKQVARADRRIREVQFQVDENKKNHDRLTELVEKLHQQLKLAKRQVEEAEELAASNVQKYRQLQGAVEETESRADTAETNLSKMRTKSRSVMTPGPGGLAASGSRASVLRSSSRARASGMGLDHY